MLTLSQIRAFYPGMPEDVQTSIHLLKEYVELMVLNYLSSSKYIEKLSFIGGTNLRLIKGIDRFSEDLDFDCKNLPADEFTRMTDDVIRFLQKNGLPAEPKDKESDKLTAMRRSIRFPELLYNLGLASEAERNRKFLLKIEAQNQGVEYKPEKAMVSMDGFHFQIPQPPADVMCSMKLSTILSRGKGRDWYDSMFLMQMAGPDYVYLSLRNGIHNADELESAILKKIAATDLVMKSRDFEYLIFDKNKARTILDYETAFSDWLHKQ